MACNAGMESPNVSEMRVVRDTASSGAKLRSSQVSHSVKTFSFPVQSLIRKSSTTGARNGSLEIALLKASG